MSVWSDMWEYREREYAITFYVPLMYFEYRDVSLLTRVHPSQRDTSLCDSAFNGSKDAFFIQPSAMELSVNYKMCEPWPSFRMFM